MLLHDSCSRWHLFYYQLLCLLPGILEHEPRIEKCGLFSILLFYTSRGQVAKVVWTSAAVIRSTYITKNLYEAAKGEKTKHQSSIVNHPAPLTTHDEPRTGMGAAEAGAGAEAERICVLGGGFGGLYAALRLEKMPWRGRKPIITLVDKRDKFTFLPLLYEFASESRGWGGGSGTTVEAVSRAETLFALVV